MWRGHPRPRHSFYCSHTFSEFIHLKQKVLLSWSSGKDSAWTLHVLRQRTDVEVVGLLTTINTNFQRVAMHGTRHALLKAQANAGRLCLGHSARDLRRRLRRPLS
jgi:tRNA(Ile)-lysidine synthase TilS/MesJ